MVIENNISLHVRDFAVLFLHTWWHIKQNRFTTLSPIVFVYVSEIVCSILTPNKISLTTCLGLTITSCLFTCLRLCVLFWHLISHQTEKISDIYTSCYPFVRGWVFYLEIWCPKQTYGLGKFSLFTYQGLYILSLNLIT